MVRVFQVLSEMTESEEPFLKLTLLKAMSQTQVFPTEYCGLWMLREGNLRIAVPTYQTVPLVEEGVLDASEC